MTLQTRELTGLDPWPLSLITGPQKSGKTHQAVAASASPLIDRTFWFAFGEPNPDGFKNIDTGGLGSPRVEPVLYDGTYRGLIGGIQDAVNEPRTDARKPNLIVVDSGTKIWEMIKDMAQAQANKRWLKRNEGKELPEDTEIVISSDLWNTARDRWDGIVNLLLKHDGPAIITARLDHVNVVNAKGDPTGAKVWTIKANKSLPSEVDAIIEVSGRNRTKLTGVRSSLIDVHPDDHHQFPDFSFDAFWRKLGLADNAVGVRDYVTSTGAESQDNDEYVVAARKAIFDQLRNLAVEYRVPLAFFAQRWEETYKHPIEQTADIGALELFRDDAASKLKARAEAARAKQMGAVA
jgi:hypothetical protein